MELTDLRIGNKYIGYSENIEEVNLDFFNLLSNDVEIDEIIKSYIPLTEEILLKCGFRMDGDVFDDDTRFTVWRNAKTFDGFIADWADKVICEVKYLHQLQNLYFALTQTELTINL